MVNQKKIGCIINWWITIISNKNELQNSVFCTSFSIWLKSAPVQVKNRKAFAINFEFWKSFLVSKLTEGINIT